MNRTTLSLAQVHLAVFLFGLSGLFGKFLDLPATIIVLGRTGFATLALGIWLVSRRSTLDTWSPRTGRDWLGFGLLGMLLAFHWVSFFRSIQLSTVAVGLLTFSSFPVFVTLLEPWWFGVPLKARDGAIALLVLIGVALVIPDYDLSTSATVGALWGLASGLSFAVLQLLNKGYRERYGAGAIAFYQDGFAFLSLLVVSPWMSVTLASQDWGLLLILGVACTALAHTLFIESLSVLRTQVASVISSLEPVYGILLALLLLGEVPDGRVIFGGCLIVGTTAAATYWR